MRQSIRNMIESSPALKDGCQVYSDTFSLEVNGVLNIYYDLTIKDCELILNAQHLKVIQFAAGAPNVETLDLINSVLLACRPDVQLNVMVREFGPILENPVILTS